MSFNESKATKIIKRRINNDTIEEVICDSNLLLTSGNKTNKSKENYMDFGLESYNVRIISYLNLTSKIKDEKLNDIMKLIIKNLNFIESHNYFDYLGKKNNDYYNKEDENRKENMFNNYSNETSSMSNSKNLSLRNLDFFEMKSKDFCQKEFIFKLIDFSILNKNFGLKFVVYLSPLDIKISYSINIFFDETEKALFSNGLNLEDINILEKDLITLPFNLPIFIFIIPLEINLKFGINIGFKVLMDFKHKDIDKYYSILIQPNIRAWLSATVSTNYPVLKAGVRANGGYSRN